MAVVDVKGCEFVFPHSVDLFDVNEFTIRYIRQATIRGRSGSEGDFLCKAGNASSAKSRMQKQDRHTS